MFIKVKNKSYDARRLTPSQRLESLWERNHGKSGDNKIDSEDQKRHEAIYKEVKNQE